MAVRIKPRRRTRRPRRSITTVRRRRRQPKPRRAYRAARSGRTRRSLPRTRPRRRYRASTPKRRRRHLKLRSRRPPRKPRRHRRRRPFPWWRYPYPPWFVVETRRGINGRSPTKPPPWANRPEMRRYSRAAQSALWRHHMLRGVWIDRLMRADDQLVRFVNRFYRAPGFHYVVRDYFDGRFKRNLAQLAMRLAARLRDRERTLRFERSLTFAAGGAPVRGVKLVSKGVHYVLNTWPRFDGAAMRQQFRRSVSLYGMPRDVRWVFDGRRLQLGKQGIVAAVRRALRRSGPGRDVGNGRAWLDNLNRLVMIV